MEKTDQQLVADYLAGDDEAFRFLVDRLLKPVYGFVCRFIGDPAEAEDVTQDVFVKVWRNLGKYRSGQSFRVWVFAIARNASIDRMRRKRPEFFSDFDDGEGGNALTDTMADTTPLPDEIAVNSETSRLLEKAIQQLPPRYREVVAMRRDAETTFDEIGAVLGRPPDTVKSQYRRALSILRRLLVDTPAADQGQARGGGK